MFKQQVQDVNVVEAAEKRIVNAFDKNKIMGFGFSGGKDSICLADMIVKTMQKYHIAFNRLIVYFFDEEAIYPDVERIVMNWRSKFLSLGAKFYWFCIPVKHFNCCNRLANDETFICWEPGKESVWVRPMPKFAIRDHKDLKPGMNYQTFSARIFKNIPNFVGLRTAESVQRLAAISVRRGNNDNRFVYPIYDWKDGDIWLYIKLYNVEFPEAYIYLYKTGQHLNRLRISQFFSIDTIRSLPKVMEFYPDLYERVIRREPNADLVMLYWDTDMFRSSQQDEKFGIEKDYRKLLMEAMADAVKHPDSYPGYHHASQLLTKSDNGTSDKALKGIYQILVAGDPKGRTRRSVERMLRNRE